MADEDLFDRHPDLPPRPIPARDRQQAVAMRYDSDRDAAPKLIAKGAGSTAERILALAREHGIPLYEDADLVTLLGVLDLGAEIPPSLYRALAEVLAFIYRADQNAR